MDSDQGKLFIGGLSWETSEEKLKDHFELYGEVLQTVVMKDKASGRPRGFGFVVFADPSTIDRVLQETHTIDGRAVDAKKAMSREEQQTTSRPVSTNGGRSFGGSGGNYKTKKIFVGGLPPTLTEEGFRQYFEAYGAVSDVVIMYDQQTQRPRGFGFIVFESEETVERVVVKNFHDLLGKTVEVKRAMPKDANPGGGGGGGRSMGSAGGGYQGGYGGSGGNLGSYDGRKSQDAVGGGYPSYGSGYNNAPASYGYGGGENYGVYGGYGGSNPGYGGPAGATYGNPNATGAGYGSGPQGSWNGQAASGYGNSGTWSGQNANGAAMMGQSPGGTAAAAAGYGNQGYGYGGGYGGSDGSYGNQAAVGAYGAVGGRPAGVQSGNGSEMHGSYMSGGYGDLNGNNSGYGNQGWRTDPTQNSANYGADNGYGGGYGSAPAQQVQQQ